MISPFAAVWAPHVAAVAVRGAWESAVIGLFFAMAMRSLRGLAATMRFRLWAAGFASASLLPFLRFAGEPSPGAGAAAPAAHFTPIGVSADWAVALCALWALATLFLLVRLAAGAWSLRRTVRAAAAAPAVVQQAYRRVAVDHPRAAAARVLVSGELSTPSACGVDGPVVLLPAGLAESLSEQDLECVLRHEAAHLARRDDWLALLTAFTRALLPLSFAIPYLERGMARAREMACDDAALACGIPRPRYAACLARMAETSLRRRVQELAPGLGGDGSQLTQRVGHILRGARPGTRPSTRLVRLYLAAAGCCAVLLMAGLLGAPAVLVFRSPSQAPQAARLALAARQALPGLESRAVGARLPLQRIRPVRWMPPVSTQPAPARMQLAAAQPLQPPSPAPRMTIRQASATVAAQAPVRPSVYLVWRRQTDPAPSGFLLFFPADRRDGTPAHILLLSI